MSDPRVHINRDFDRSTCIPEDQSPPVDEDWHLVEESTECSGLEAFNLDDYEIESVTDTECALAAAGELFDPAEYLIETTVGGDCEECCCCACPCCCGTGYWTQYIIHVEGIGPNPGSLPGYCEKFNGSWTLTNDPFGTLCGSAAGCCWTFNNGLPGLDNVNFWLICGGDDITGGWTLHNDNTGASWSGLHGSDFACDCGGTLTYNLGTQEGCDGDNMPNVTITPAGEWVSCGKAEPNCEAEFAAFAALPPEEQARRVEARRGGAELRKARSASREARKVGPGTELKKLIAELGLAAVAGCGCNDLASRMNKWGVEGCRLNREVILAKLRESKAHLGWLAKLKAGALAVKAGLVLNPLDPAPGLLDCAIRRARDAATG